MDKNRRRILIGFALVWLMLIIWGATKSYKISTKRIKKEGVVTEKEEVKEEGKIKKSSVTSPQEETPILVRAFRVKKVDFNDVLPVMGSIKAKAEIPLRFQISGVIKKIYFKEGDIVKKGDLIASLDPKDAQLKLSYAENKLKSAQASYESLLKRLEIYKKLYEAGVIIEAKLKQVELDVENAKAQLEAAKAEKKLASEELRKTKIYAIKDGVMGPRKAEEGEFVTPQNQIGSLLDISEVYVEVGIVEKDLHKVKLGQKALIFVDAYPGKTFKGVVERLYPIVEGKSRTITAKIKVINPESLLLPGMFSRVEILSAELKDTYIVPTISLVNTGKRTFLLPVIPQDSIEEEEEGTFIGRVELRIVNVGYISSDYAQILTGVSEGDLVVTETQGELKDGLKVRVIGIEEFGE